jgi:uncharacterized protein (DUF305 family)
MKRLLWCLIVVLMVGALPAAADEPVDGRAGRAEVRFLQGMIDHHQMALDMAAHCLERAATDDLKALCQAVIDAQSAEIAQMLVWLRDWYAVDYAPMSMLSTITGSTDHAQHAADPVVTAESGSMNMMQGMMSGGQMGMDMMHGMMQAYQMGMMHGMMQSMMQGMMSGGQMGMDMMHGMMGEQPSSSQDHSQHHPAQGEAPADHSQHQQGQGEAPADHSQHQQGQGEALRVDPSMMMGMFAGLNHLEGHLYDIAWLESMIDHHGDALHMSERILQQAQHEELIALANAIISAQTAEIAQMEAMIEVLNVQHEQHSNH